jgi:transposase
LNLPAQSIPQPDPTLAEIIAQLQEQLARKDQALALAEVKIKVLEERLRLDRIARYGKRSEMLSDLQLQLLDLEPGVSSEEVEAESEREPLQPQTPQDKPASKHRRKHPGRQELPAHLERVEQIVACTLEQCNCGRCGKQTTVIGYEETEVLDVRPAEYYVKVIRREKRACRDCEEQGVATAPVPERIVAKSVLSDQVIIEVLVAKCCASLPLYRQQAIIKRDAGVQIAVSTLNDGVLRVGELLIPISAAMKREVLAGTYIQADETPIGVQTHDKRGAIIKLTCGSTDRRVKAWCSTSGWVAKARARSSSWAISMGCSRPTAIKDTTTSAARRWFTPAVSPTRGVSSSMP